MTIKDQETIEAIHNLFHEVVEFVQVAFDDVKQSPERSFEHYQKIMKLPICQSDTEFPEWVNVPPPFIAFLGSIYKDSLQAMIQFIEPVLTWTTGLREKHKNLKKWQLETKKLLKRAFFSKMALHDFMCEVGTLETHFGYEYRLYLEGQQEKIESSMPLGLKDWATIFDVGKNKMRDMMRDNKYHFRQISPRKWTLPKNELPTEYLEKYRKAPS